MKITIRFTIVAIFLTAMYGYTEAQSPETLRVRKLVAENQVPIVDEFVSFDP
jgi:hypothetical protein